MSKKKNEKLIEKETTEIEKIEENNEKPTAKKNERPKSYMYIGPTIKKVALVRGTVKIGDGHLKTVTNVITDENILTAIRRLFVLADKNVGIKLKNCEKVGTRENVNYIKLVEYIKRGEI